MSEIAGENRETTLHGYVKELGTYDLIKIGEQLVELDEEESRVYEEKSNLSSKYAAELKRIKSDMKRLLRMYRTKEEHVIEECSFEYNYTEGMVLYYSVESGQIVDSRAITQEERQMKLFSNNLQIPKCHMKDMKREGDTWHCQVCDHTKPVIQAENNNNEEVSDEGN